MSNKIKLFTRYFFILLFNHFVRKVARSFLVMFTFSQRYQLLTHFRQKKRREINFCCCQSGQNEEIAAEK